VASRQSRGKLKEPSIETGLDLAVSRLVPGQKFGFI
jgi:hypothetical protein